MNPLFLTAFGASDGAGMSALAFRAHATHERYAEMEPILEIIPLRGNSKIDGTKG